MSKKDEIINILEQYPQYWETLFRRGYLITTRNDLSLDSYPFYRHWNKAMFGKIKDGRDVHVYYHELQDYHCFEENDIAISMIGHAYNPFNMQYQEEEILIDLLHSYNHGEEAFFDKISELTGIHLIIVNDLQKLVLVQDCSGMRACYYGTISNDLCITSHPQLVGDIFNLEVDKFIDNLINAYFFRISMQYLPGDLSPYQELKRLGPNTYLTYSKDFNIYRFYPLKEHAELSENQYDEIIDTITSLIHKNIELCSKKWQRAAISLSGGMDSNTTLACANGLYDKFNYYSFHSKPSEVIDAESAHNISSKLDLKHTIYAIPDRNEEIEDYNILKKIICHNTSYIQIPSENEIRKFIYLYRLCDISIELKSWISEIGRAILDRKFGAKLPETITPRLLSILQSRFFAAPKLFKMTERAYEKFIENTGLDKPLYNYEHPDFIDWEARWGTWGSIVVCAQDIFYSKVTMPFNNRKIMDMFLWFPRELREKDMIQSEIIKRSNPKLSEIVLDNYNPHSSNMRQLLERTYYYYRMILKNNWI